MKLRIYLDTSVFSAYYDDRIPDRQVETQEFWNRLNQFEIATSGLTKEELSQTPGTEQRLKFKKLLEPLALLTVTPEMESLARAYVDAGVFTAVMFNDALHVAVAVLSRQDVLVSWNFRHLVNRRRRAMVNEVNILKSLPTIEIWGPPEI